jgi:hypothetical protein
MRVTTRTILAALVAAVLAGDGVGRAQEPGSAPSYIYTRADLMMLHRDRADRVNFATGGPLHPIVLNSDDLNFDHEGIMRFAAGAPLDPLFTLEAVYFGLGDWSETAQISSPQFEIFGPFSNFGAVTLPVSDFEPANRVTIDYRSQLHNCELNGMATLARHDFAELFFITGARYFRLEEEFEYDAQAFNTNAFYHIKTENDLIGGQIGLQGAAWAGPVRLEGFFKAAVFGNVCDQLTTTDATFRDGYFQEFETSDDVSFMFDASLSIVADVASFMSVRGGWTMMWVSEVALAPEQFNPIDPSSGQRTPAIDANGSILYQGPTFGVEIRW